MRCVFLAAAERDISVAVAWYHHQLPGLGSRLLDEVQQALTSIQSYPYRYPVVHRQFRAARLKHFPYRIIFNPGAEVIEIVAVYHFKRHPFTWQSRKI